MGYRLLVPTRYEGGHYRLVLPAKPEHERDIHSDPSHGIPPTIVPHGDGGVLEVNGQPWPNGEPIRFDPRRGLELSLRPPAAGWTVDGALAVIPFGDRFLTHAHVEVVPELSQRPRGARVVIVLDRSRSLTEELADGARAAARAYLSHLPDAHVEVVTYAREATRRYGRFVSSAEARRDLASWRPQRGNGSEIGDALSLARQILDGGASGHPRRIVVLTDGKIRHDLPVDALSEDLGDGAPLTQIVQLSDPMGRHQPRLTRDDGTDWMAVAELSGGLAWNGTFPVATETPPDLRPAIERLVRPTVLASFELKSAPFVDASDLFVTSELGEGEGISVTAMLNEPLPWLTAVGKRWHDEVSVTLPVHDAEAAVWAALAFGNDGLPLDDDAVARLALARRGGAVTELTSYAVGRTAEPPPLERVGSGRFGRAHGLSTRCGIGRGMSLSMEGREWLENALRQALYACGAQEHRATVAFETIGREIAQVDGATVTSEGAPASLASCLTRAAWALELPVKHFENRASRRWSVEVRAILP
ncbi:MAG TPA: VWA domain-containing protein [Polyangiaceae bacterium]|nr:VWA domain-containing protein [Polyangiaceae bacterium]